MAVAARLHLFGTCIETARDRSGEKVAQRLKHAPISWADALGTGNAESAACPIPLPCSRNPIALFAT